MPQRPLRMLTRQSWNSHRANRPRDDVSWVFKLMRRIIIIMTPGFCVYDNVVSTHDKLLPRHIGVRFAFARRHWQVPPDVGEHDEMRQFIHRSGSEEPIQALQALAVGEHGREQEALRAVVAKSLCEIRHLPRHHHVDVHETYGTPKGHHECQFCAVDDAVESRPGIVLLRRLVLLAESGELVCWWRKPFEEEGAV